MDRMRKERAIVFKDHLGITQKQLADFCNLSHNGISQIELGNKDIRISTLLKIAKMLGIKISFEMD